MPSKRSKSGTSSPARSTEQASGDASVVGSVAEVPTSTDTLADIANEDEEEQQQSKSAAKTTKDMRSVDKYEAEREDTVDMAKMNQAMNIISSVSSNDNEERLKREKELAKVKISKTDVELIVNELSISQKRAERCLRECSGDAVEAMRKLINA